jgi:acyl-CoA synthetase (AMP-forming)/AMP-acid ligase II
MVYVGLNFRMTATELHAVLTNAQPRMLITDPEFLPTAQALSQSHGLPVLVLDEGGSYEEALATGSAEFPVWAHTAFPKDPFAIVYTSGTTGLPKGILFDHAAALQHGAVACLEYEINERSRYLIQIPHNSCVNITMVPALMAGAAIGFAESRSFNSSALCEVVQRHAVTHTFLVPTMLATLLAQDPGDFPQRLATLTTLGYGSAPIPAERLRELIKRYGPIFIQLYGMAEIASIGTLPPSPTSRTCSLPAGSRPMPPPCACSRPAVARSGPEKPPRSSLADHTPCWVTSASPNAPARP